MHPQYTIHDLGRVVFNTFSASEDELEDVREELRGLGHPWDTKWATERCYLDMAADQIRARLQAKRSGAREVAGPGSK